MFRTNQFTINPRHYITDLSTKLNSYCETTLELDSHADTCVLGCDVLIFLDYDRPVVVEGYELALGTKRHTPPLAEALLMIIHRPAKCIT